MGDAQFVPIPIRFTVNHFTLESSNPADKQGVRRSSADRGGFEACWSVVDLTQSGFWSPRRGSVIMRDVGTGMGGRFA